MESIWRAYIYLTEKEKIEWLKENYIHKLATGSSVEDLLNHAPTESSPCIRVKAVKNENGFYDCTTCPLSKKLRENFSDQNLYHMLITKYTPCCFRYKFIDPHKFTNYNLQNKVQINMTPEEIPNFINELELEKELEASRREGLPKEKISREEILAQAIHWLKVCVIYNAGKHIRYYMPILNEEIYM